MSMKLKARWLNRTQEVETNDENSSTKSADDSFEDIVQTTKMPNFTEIPENIFVSER